jgi:autotransporter-associated beta strand protein
LPLRAQTWDGGGFSDSFSDFFNWNPNSAPANNGSANVVFAGSTRLTPFVDTLWNLRSIAFGFNAGSFNISGAPILIGQGGISNFSFTQQTLNTPFAFVAPQVWDAGDGAMVFTGNIDNSGHALTVSGSSNTAITGQIIGTGGFIKEGSGMVGFGGPSPNTYTGATIVNAGTLVLAKPAGTSGFPQHFGSAIGGPLTINTGAMVRLGGNHQIPNSQPVTIRGALDLNGFTEEAGPLTMTAGTITTGGGLFTLMDDLLTTASAAESTISGNMSISGFRRRLTVEDGAAVNDLNIQAVISGSEGFEKWGEGTLRLSGNNTFTGTFNLVTGTIAVASHTALGTGTFQTSNAFPTIRPDGGPREIPNRFDIFGAFTVAGPHPLTFSGPASLNTFFINMAIENSTTFEGPISGNSSGDEFKKSGSGTLIFRGAEPNTHNLNLALNAGTVLLAKDAGVAALPRNVTVGDGLGGPLADVLRWGNSYQYNPLFGSRITTINSSGLLDMAGFSDNLGNVTMTGGTLRAGATTVIGDIKTNAHTASAIISNGTVSLAGGARVLDIADGAVAVDLEISAALSSPATSSVSKKGAGAVLFSGPVNLGGGFTLDGGLVEVMSGGMSASAFTQNDGAYNGNLTARESFTFNGGSISGRLNNQGAATLNANLSLAGLTNSGTLTLSPSPTLSVGAFGLDNQGVMTLAGGALTASGPLVNSGLVSGFGTIGGAGGFTNNSLLRQTGTLVLSNTGLNENFGNIDLAAGQQLQLNGGSLTNAGTLNLNDALISGSGVLTNTFGGVIAGRGIINTAFANSGGVVVVQGGTTRISAGFSNEGTIELIGASASMTGGSIENTGNIQGFGSAGNDIGNNGIIATSGGNLVLAGRVRNFEKGLLSAAAGSQLTIARGLGSNGGIINLLGGVFENSGFELDNAGQISGFGTLRTGTLINNGTITFTGGFTTINGDVINESDRQLRVAYNPALFTGNVTNNGILKNTETTITFAGTYTENGLYISDPADNFFSSVSIGDEGAWVGGWGDRFFITGDLKSTSKAKSSWQTELAELHLIGGAEHVLSIAGADLGVNFDGYVNNFAWGSLLLGSGDELVLEDANDSMGGALYVHSLLLGGGIDQIADIQSNGLNIYYDLGNSANAYLGGKSYELAGGGTISAVPEPVGALWVVATGIVLRRRRK